MSGTINNVDAWFIKDYKSDVFVAYQRTQSMLADTVRKATVKGLTAQVPKYGTATAGTKDRNGLVPVSNPNHGTVEWNVTDFYSGRWVDKLDLLKTNADERRHAADAGAFALARKKDDLIVTALRSGLGSGQKITTSGGLTRDKVFAAKELLEGADVPDDGMIFCLVGPHQWSELSAIKEFSNAEWSTDLTNMGRRVNRRKVWNGITFINTGSLLTGYKTGNIRPCLMFHMSGIAFGEGMDVEVDITWHGDRAAWFINHMMSGGAKRIEDTAVVEISADDTSALPT